MALGVLGALAAAAFIVLALFIKGEKTCTELLRWPTLWVGFGEPIAEPGPYRLKVRADGKDLSCGFRVPLGRFGERGCRGFDVQGTHDGAAPGHRPRRRAPAPGASRGGAGAA
jgi:hypothetical protein